MQRSIDDIQNEINQLKQELQNLRENDYAITMERKLIRHRIYDLEYELNNSQEKHTL